MFDLLHLGGVLDAGTPEAKRSFLICARTCCRTSLMSMWEAGFFFSTTGFSALDDETTALPVVVTSAAG
jgi:hypothetical protein